MIGARESHFESQYWGTEVLRAEAMHDGRELTNAKAAAMPRSVPAGTVCAACGWPIKIVSSATYVGKDEGEKLYRHARCPSLSERRDLRRQALEVR